MDEKLLKSFESMLKKGNYAEIEPLLKEIAALNPEDWEAKMLYGTCRLLQGDTETAKQIHDEPEPHFSADLDLPKAKRTFWQKYHRWIIYGTATALVVAVTGCFFGKAISNMFTGISDRVNISPEESWRIQTVKYAAPEYFRCDGYRSPDHAPARNNRPENE